MKKHFILSQKTCAIRHKGFHVVNVHSTLTFIARFALKHMPEKLKQRVKFYTSFDEISVLNTTDLPIECGGEAELRDLVG